MNLLSILFQTPAGGSQWSGILMMVVIVAIFYFFMIRPQNKKQKKIQEFRNGLKNGQEVVTIGGLHGTIKDIADNGIVTLEVATGVKMKFEKSAIMPNGVTENK